MTDWVFQAPNLLLAALMYTLIGRFLLSIVFAPDSEKVIWRVFVTITSPFVGMARVITPQVVPLNLLVLFTAIWVLLARVALLFAFAGAGVLPKLGA